MLHCDIIIVEKKKTTVRSNICMNNTTANNLPLQPLLFTLSDIEECTFIPVDKKESLARIELTELTSESLRVLLLKPQCWKRFFFTVRPRKR